MSRPHTLPSVLLAALVAASLLTGCGEDGSRLQHALDSTLTRAEGLMAADRDREAREYLLSSLISAPEIWRGRSLPDGLRMIADLYRASARFDSAMLFFHQAAEEYRNHGRRDEGYAMTLTNGDLLRQMGRSREALALYDETLRLATIFGDSAAAREVLWRKLPLLHTLDLDRDAQEVLTRLGASARAGQDIREEARVALATALSAAERGDTFPSIDLFLRAVALATQGRDSVLGTRALMHLALSMETAGRQQDATETFSTALQRHGVLAASSPLHLELLLRMGNVELRRRRPADAVPFFRNALLVAQQVRNGAAEACALAQLGFAVAERDREEGLRQIRAAYDQCKLHMVSPGMAYTLLLLGKIAERENRLVDAVQLYADAVAAQESQLRRRSPDDILVDCAQSTLGAGRTDASAVLIGLLLQTGKSEEAFKHQSRHNAHRFLVDLAAWEFRPGGEALNSLFAEYEHQRALHVGAEEESERLFASRPGAVQLIHEIAAVKASAAASLRDKAQQIIAEAPAYRAVVSADGLRPAELQSRLPETTVVVTFLPVLPSFTVAAFSRAGGTIQVSGYGTERVMEWCRRYQEMLHMRRMEADSLGPGRRPLDRQIQELTSNLHEAMVLPVEGMLRSGMRVVVVYPPDMPVIPFHALRRSTSAPYVAERYAVTYAPVLEMVGGGSAQSRPVRSVVCLGFAGTTSWDVEYELRDVQYFSKDARLLFGRAATLDSLRRIQSDVLHLAVEMQFGRRHPLQGGIMLSDGTTRTGQRLVPLSSLVGLPPSGAVLISNLSGDKTAPHPGVPYALLANGTAATVVNTFPPLRGAKKVFNELFYTSLQAGDDTEEAFRKAQMGMISRWEWSAPHLWAPFMLWSR